MLTKEILRRIRVNQNEPKPGDLFGHGIYKFKASMYLLTKNKKLKTEEFLQEKRMIRSDQIGFVRKVFGLVGTMLCISVAFVVL